MVRIRSKASLAIIALIAGMPALAHADATTSQVQAVQAEAESNLARAFAEANQALTQLNNGPVDPQQVSTPKGVSVAAPAAPVKTSLPKIDLAKLPVDLRRPVTIRWNGPVEGAIKKIAAQMNYKVLPPTHKPATPPTIVLVKKKVPAAIVLQDIGARIRTYGKLVVSPGARTIQFDVNKAAGA